MFLGEFEHNVDDKGRLTVPVRLRPELSEGAFVTRGFDGCLVVYPLKAWNEMAARLKALPTTRRAARYVSRMFFAGSEIALDKQGRISIPPPLRDHADIQPGSEVIVVGVNDRIELWNKARWAQVTEELEQKSTDFEAALDEFGI